jgi:TolA-binding protein
LFKVVEKYPKAFLVDDALMLAGRIQIQEGEYRKAIETLERLLNEFKETSIALDQARFSIAEIYQFGLKDTVNATAAYQSLLADFPNSLLAEKARRRIRDLRGESM